MVPLFFVVLWVIFAIVADATSSDGADDPLNTIVTFNAHPVMFGKRWTTVVTANVTLVTANLCSAEEWNSTNIFDTKKSSNNSDGGVNSSIISDNLNENHHGIALYHEPSADDQTGEVQCEYAYMAQVAQSMYPEARYLLFPYYRLQALPNTQDIPNPDNLSVAVVTFQDGQEIRGQAIRNLINETSDHEYRIRIDAVSRSIFDLTDADDGNEIILWVTLTRISSALSFLGSMYVILSLVGTKERRRDNLKPLFNRQLLAISVSDVMSSTAMFSGAWAAPPSPPGNFEGYYSQRRWDLLFPYASGNEATCSAAGFFMQVGVLGSTLFTGFFAIQALLVVRYAWKDERMKLVERLFFVIGIGFPLITGVWTTANRMMNPMAVGFCWISPYPAECAYWNTTGAIIDEYCDTVLVGEDYLFYQVALANAWAFLILVVIIYSMISLYLFVRKQERRGSWWAYSNDDRRLEKKVFAKAIMYISVHLMIWIPTFLAIVGQIFVKGFDLANMFLCLLLPFQGGFNALIYSGMLEKCLVKLSCCIADRDSSAIGSRSFSLRYEGVIPSSVAESRIFTIEDDGGVPESPLEQEDLGGNTPLNDAQASSDGSSGQNNSSPRDDGTEKTSNRKSLLHRIRMGSVSSLSRSSRNDTREANVKVEQSGRDDDDNRKSEL